jgi:signal transduction histidine kinase
MGVDYYQQLTTGNSSGFLQTSLPILIIAFPVAFLARNIRLFRSMNEFNTLLTSQLQQRETELAENYARQGELLRRETLVAERQRLMRDMHDGIGGQLMSLLFASRRKQLPQAEMTESLQAVIDELRLVIDSLDTVGETLTTALAGFRSRVEPKLSTAGIELRWSNTLPDTKNSLGPREVLQIFRIVQEAVTNVIKHAGSPTLDIAIGPFPDDAGYIVIRISDAGVGQSETASTGHGLQNMAERAKSIGAALTTDVTESGRTVSLKIPISVLGDGQAMAQ